MNTLILNGVEIIKREDGMINATQLCKAGKKFWKDFKRLEQTKSFIRELSVEKSANSEQGRILPSFPNKESLKNFKYGAVDLTGIIDEIVTGPKHLWGTWVCKELAVKLAAWISPAFEVQVMRWAWSMVNGEVEKIVPEAVQRADALNDTTSEVLINTVDNDLRRREIDLRERELELEKRKFENQVRMNWVTKWQELGLSERETLRLKDFISNLLDCSPIENKEEEVTISSRAAELGLRLSHIELTRAGMRLSKLYHKKYGAGAKIPKRTQYVDGAPRSVNSYTKKDIDLIDKAILK